MRYNKIRKYDVANGTGIRSTLFVAGCTHRCKGCFNEEYQSFSSGEPWTSEVEEALLQHLKESTVQGITILGGEPLDQIQDDDLVTLLRRIRLETTCDIWIYSGYTFEQLMRNEKQREILKECDVLVDGPFVESLKDLKLRFRGSSNQRLIELKPTFESGEIKLLKI